MARLSLIICCALGFVLTACSDEPQTEYLAENTDDFFAACTDPTTDSIMETRLCQCVIDTVVAETPFAEFAALDAELGAEVAEGEEPMETPQEIVDIVADCVVEVADL